MITREIIQKGLEILDNNENQEFMSSISTKIVSQIKSNQDTNALEDIV